MIFVIIIIVIIITIIIVACSCASSMGLSHGATETREWKTRRDQIARLEIGVCGSSRTRGYTRTRGSGRVWVSVSRVGSGTGIGSPRVRRIPSLGLYHIGHRPYRPQPHRPYEKTLSATMNNHIGHRKMYCCLASTFKIYPFETRNVVYNPVSRKWRVKKLNNCRSIRYFSDLMWVVKSLSIHCLRSSSTVERLTDSFGN